MQMVSTYVCQVIGEQRNNEDTFRFIMEIIFNKMFLHDLKQWNQQRYTKQVLTANVSCIKGHVSQIFNKLNTFEVLDLTGWLVFFFFKVS